MLLKPIAPRVAARSVTTGLTAYDLRERCNGVR